MTSMDGPQLEFRDDTEFKVADGTSLSPAGEAAMNRGPASLERPGGTAKRTCCLRVHFMCALQRACCSMCLLQALYQCGLLQQRR